MDPFTFGQRDIGQERYRKNGQEDRIEIPARKQGFRAWRRSTIA
jgi:hypothetical protein